MVPLLDITAVGRAGVDLYSLDYNTPLEKVRRFAKYVGGTTANTVVGGSRLGLRCALVTRVGDDELGRFVADFLASEGVETKHVRFDGSAKTGIVFAEVYPGRDSKFVFYRENVADLRITKADVDKKTIRQSRVVLITGTGLSAEPSYGTVLYAARLASKAGSEVVLNLDWRPSLWKLTRRQRVARYAKAMEYSNMVIGNEGEYMAATGRSDIRGAISSIPEWRSKTLVITKGEKGSTVIRKGRESRVDGFSVPLLKGLGGGDGFIAGFLFGHLKGWEAARAARFGNAVGAIVVTGHACSESMPSLEEAVEFLRKRGIAFDMKKGPSKD